MRPDLIVLVNPNSPTGQHWPRSQVVRFLDHIPDSITVVIDETYIEYVGSYESVEQEVIQRPNLLVMKSMSKVYGLSGLRVGYLVAYPSLVRRLALSVPPWSVSLPAQLAAIEALGDSFYYQERYRETAALRKDLASRLELNSTLKIYDSKANFLLVETMSSAQDIVDAMSQHNVFVRNCDSMSDRFNDRFLRIAVKEQHENKRIADSLQTVTGSLR